MWSSSRCCCSSRWRTNSPRSLTTSRPSCRRHWAGKRCCRSTGALWKSNTAHHSRRLPSKPGMLGVIFKGARCDIHNPALLKQLIVNLLDKVDWLSLPVDVKGTIYEELLSALRLGIHQGRRPVFHPAAGHPAHGRGDATHAQGPHLRPGRGHRRLPLQRLPVRARPLRAGPRPRREAGAARRSGRGHGAVAQGRRACAR